MNTLFQTVPSACNVLSITVKDSCNKWQLWLQPPPLAWRCNKFTYFVLIFFLHIVPLFFHLFSHFFDHRRNCHPVADRRCCQPPLLLSVALAWGHPISHEHVNVYTRTAILCLHCPHPHSNPSPPPPFAYSQPHFKSDIRNEQPTNQRRLELILPTIADDPAEPSASRQRQAKISRSSPVSLVASSRDRVRQLHLICRRVLVAIRISDRVCVCVREQEQKNRKRDS